MQEGKTGEKNAGNIHREGREGRQRIAPGGNLPDISRKAGPEGKSGEPLERFFGVVPVAPFAPFAVTIDFFGFRVSPAGKRGSAKKPGRGPGGKVRRGGGEIYRRA